MAGREFVASLKQASVEKKPKLIKTSDEEKAAAKEAEKLAQEQNTAAKIEKKRQDEFFTICAQKLKPIFQQVMKNYKKGKEFKLNMRAEQVDSFHTFLITLDWQTDPKIQKRAKFPWSIPQHIYLRVYLDAMIIGKEEVQKNCHVIEPLSPKYTQKTNNHLIPHFGNPTTLHDNDWQKKAEQEILKQLGIYEPLS